MSDTSEPSRPPAVVEARVTDARASRVDDQNARLWKYLILNGLRVVCLFAVFLTPQPWGLLWLVGAVIFPYLAVVIANNVGEAHPGSLTTADAVTSDATMLQTHPTMHTSPPRTPHTTSRGFEGTDTHEGSSATGATTGAGSRRGGRRPLIAGEIIDDDAARGNGASNS